MIFKRLSTSTFVAIVALSLIEGISGEWYDAPLKTLKDVIQTTLDHVGNPFSSHTQPYHPVEISPPSGEQLESYSSIPQPETTPIPASTHSQLETTIAQPTSNDLDDHFASPAQPYYSIESQPPSGQSSQSYSSSSQPEVTSIPGVMHSQSETIVETESKPVDDLSASHTRDYHPIDISPPSVQPSESYSPISQPEITPISASTHSQLETTIVQPTSNDLDDHSSSFAQPFYPVESQSSSGQSFQNYNSNLQSEVTSIPGVTHSQSETILETASKPVYNPSASLDQPYYPVESPPPSEQLSESYSPISQPEATPISALAHSQSETSIVQPTPNDLDDPSASLAQPYYPVESQTSSGQPFESNSPTTQPEATPIPALTHSQSKTTIVESTSNDLDDPSASLDQPYYPVESQPPSGQSSQSYNPSPQPGTTFIPKMTHSQSESNPTDLLQQVESELEYASKLFYGLVDFWL